MSEFIWIVIGMGVVTYVPRMLPLTALHNTRLPKPIQAVLRNVPYAVLGALVFPNILIINAPGLLQTTPSDWLFGGIGAITAFVTAYLGWNVMFVVLTSIAVLSVYTVLF
ncbi:AzlD domain-containing protein [Tuberibacillus sp. Marseille-P3662]|uniref:AzlD domain-containing protein n=1 Tax=Tuberibacillus sp. Marseille-P3662 TaxID=1965358 RepID=UPI000A1C8E72|nr:AzlD domain-containing protein [Tuberibacillus sp. Marseille-P3662]